MPPKNCIPTSFNHYVLQITMINLSFMFYNYDCTGRGQKEKLFHEYSSEVLQFCKSRLEYDYGFIRIVNMESTDQEGC